jgi:hypothetical protein
MKKIALWLSLAIVATAAVVLIAADHTDAPAVAGTPADIADFYAFEGENAAATTVAVTLPAATSSTQFDENTIIEINVDNTGLDTGTAGVTEDLVIQALRQGDKMYFFGPYLPSQKGVNSAINRNNAVGSVDINGIATLTNGMKVFAGQHQDAFYLDFQQFNTDIGTAPAEGFGTTGTNTFAPSNVNAIVVDVPNSLLGTAPTHILDHL